MPPPVTTAEPLDGVVTDTMVSAPPSGSLSLVRGSMAFAVLELVDVASFAAAGAWSPETGWRPAVRGVPAALRADVTGVLFLVATAVFVVVTEKAHTFRQGFEVTEYLSSALIDMKLHLAGGADIDPDAFERDELTKLGMPPQVVMRHRTPQFGHVFASDGYSAGYYSYLWSETLALDVVDAFKASPGGMYDKAMAKKLHDNVMSVGNSIDPAIAYRNMMGRDVDVTAYLRDKGFPTT